MGNGLHGYAQLNEKRHANMRLSGWHCLHEVSSGGDVHEHATSKSKHCQTEDALVRVLVAMLARHVLGCMLGRARKEAGRCTLHATCACDRRGLS